MNAFAGRIWRFRENTEGKRLVNIPVPKMGPTLDGVTAGVIQRSELSYCIEMKLLLWLEGACQMSSSGKGEGRAWEEWGSRGGRQWEHLDDSQSLWRD